MRAIITCTVAMLALASPVDAQDKIENSETGFFVQTSGAVPEVCGFEFKLVYRDRTYLNGQLAGTSGSLAWLEAKGNIGLMLKIVGVDFPGAAKLDMTPKPFPVLQGYVFVDGKARAPNNTFRCEEPTGFCANYWLPTSVEIHSVLFSGKLNIGFSRQAKGLDIMLPLDVRGGVAASPNDFRAFGQCIAAIADRAEATLKK